MKRIYTWGTVLSIFLFTACEKDELTTQRPDNNGSDIKDEYPINPEDTAGIVIPEGYMLAVFPGHESIETRAAVNGADSRISQLQYLIYKKDEAGTYRRYMRQVVFNDGGVKTWPYHPETVLLPNTGEFRVVFLGNVDESLFGQTTEVLTGVDPDASYSDARIILPGKEFGDNNMYYMGQADFADSDATADKVVKVPILLQRLVSRIDVRGESWDETAQTLFTDNSTKAYLHYKLRELMPPAYIYGIGGLFHKAVRNQVNRYIMGVTYVAVKGLAISEDDRNKYKVLANKYDSKDGNTLSSNTLSSLESLSIDDQKSIYDDPIYNNYRSSTLSNNILLNTAECLYEWFNTIDADSDETKQKTLTDILGTLWGMSKTILTSNSEQGENIIYNNWARLLYQYLAASTATNSYNDFKTAFTPIKGFNATASASMEINDLPTSIDFDRNVVSKDNKTRSYARKTESAANMDYYYPITVFGIGDIGINKISLTTDVWINSPINVNASTSIPYATNIKKTLTHKLETLSFKDVTKVADATTLAGWVSEGCFTDDVHETIGLAIANAVKTVVEEKLGLSKSQEYNYIPIGYNHTMQLGEYYLCKGYYISCTAAGTTGQNKINTDDYKTLLTSIGSKCSSNNDEAGYGSTTADDYQFFHIKIDLPSFEQNDLNYTHSWDLQ